MKNLFKYRIESWVAVVVLYSFILFLILFTSVKAKGDIKWESFKRIDNESHNVCYLFIATDEDNFAITSFCLPQNTQPPSYKNYAEFN